MMRHIVIEKAGRWDLALACASLSLVMLVLTGVLYGQHHVGARRAGAVDVGEPDDEVVYAADWASCWHVVPA
jgi:hypothetical protein